MSLWRHRRTIARAIAGELSPPAETRLRGHLAGCATCRAHYDRLSLAAEALAPGTSQRRAQARLQAALVAPARAAPGAVARPALRWLRWTPLVLAPAAALLFLVRPMPPPSPEIAWRGHVEPASTALGLLVYASRRVEGGVAQVRLVADLPGSGEGQLYLDDYVQFSVRALRQASYVTVVGLDEAGDVHVYAPRPDTPPRPVAPDVAPTTLGPSVALSVKHRPGRLRLFAVASAAPVDVAELSAAVRQAGFSGTLTLPGQQAAGLLAITR
jgi:Putative zinc-finger